MFNNTLIFGDSYSTFKGYIPEDFAYYYNEDEGGTDVRKVTQTWWHPLMSETNSNLCMNNSWSGSTICNTGYNNTDCSETSSFICRLNQLIDSNYFIQNKIDTVFVFGGTNDYWASAPFGTLKYADFEKKDLYSVLPAVCYFIKRLKEVLPESKIIWIINTELGHELPDGMLQACEHYNIHAIQLENIHKQCGHPDIQGMAEIKEQILKSLK